MIVSSVSRQKSVFVKFFVSNSNGIQLQNTLRPGVGYVIKGTKYIYDNNSRLKIETGDLFYLGSGNHYIEDAPDENSHYEQIILYYNTEQLGWLISQMNLNYGMNITRTHVCDDCHGQREVKYRAWDTVKFLFQSINLYIEQNLFARDDAAVLIKMTELIYLLFTDHDCCLLGRIINDSNTHSKGFEHVIRDNIFNNLSLEELSEKCGCSLTHFKKEFEQTFHEAPHQWIIKQRMTHSRLLLISTDKAISDICSLCGFHNTSHFIKTFKKEYGLTPSVYRSKYKSGVKNNDATVDDRRRKIHMEGSRHSCG
ncbi:transcriptional regulator [Bacteroidia bacterium]|nr:transcriptional regulator [Bacteroidia bacterium]